MNNRHRNPKDTSKTIMALFVVFVVIVIRDATLGTVSLTRTALLGAVVIILALSSALLPGKKTEDTLNADDR
jgi:amino acid permease